VEAGPLDLKIILIRPIVIVKNLAGQVPSSDKNISYTRIIYSDVTGVFLN
jgi:hypothetical protein